MARTVLSLSSIKDLDMGIVQEAFASELRRIVEDVKDRPHDDHARKVSINFLVKPADPHGDSVSVECEVVGSVPKRVSKPYDMTIKGNDLIFQPVDPEDADQLALDDIQKRG